MKTAEDIVALYNIRMSLRGDYLGRMADISRQYDNEVTVPLPELDRNEKPAVANLLSQGIDQYALRVASVMPPSAARSAARSRRPAPAASPPSVGSR